MAKNDDNPKTQLQKLREEKRLSVHQLGGIVGLCPDYLAKMERGLITRIPQRQEEKLRSFFGSEWTFSKLMEPASVPSRAENGG